jgi:hypothetical protein
MRYLSLKFGLLTLLLTNTTYVSAQINVINRSLTDSCLSYGYIGIDNAIELTGYKANYSISVSITNGTITNAGRNRYILRPVNLGECILTFFDKGKTIAKKDFKIELLANPIARLAGVKDSFAAIIFSSMSSDVCTQTAGSER